MTNMAFQSFQPQRGDYVLVALLLAGVYFGFGPRSAFPDRFAWLADAWVQGEWTVTVQGFPDELIPADEAGEYFVAYPPLPAVILIPLRAAIGASFGSRAACRCFCIVAVLLWGGVLSRLAQRDIGPRLRKSDWYFWVLVLGLGTAVWDSATWAGDWHYAHAVAIAFFMAALLEFFGARRWWLLGAWLGLAILARPTTAFAGVFFLLAAIERPISRQQLRARLLVIIGPLLAVALLAGYNALRFGDPFDFGYDRMTLRGEGLALMNAYGQFHAVYVPRNLFWFFFAPPTTTSDGASPFLSYDLHGISVLLASPIFLLVGVAVWRRARQRIVWTAMVGIALCLIPLLLYFNTGFAQFGHRFSMDYLPLLMLLAFVGAGLVRRAVVRVLLVVSILIHVWGLLLVHPSQQARAWRPSFIELKEDSVAPSSTDEN